MKITQEPKFQPITLVLETKEEAELLWDFIDRAPVKKEHKMITDISNWLSNEAQL